MYDASAWAWDGAPSLNECLNTGLPVYRFRTSYGTYWYEGVSIQLPLLGTSRRPFCNSGSVWKRDALRFHWLKSVEEETLRFTRVLFGLAPCPFLLGEVIKQHLESWRPTHPESVCEIQKSLYMDDLITGATTTGKAREVKWLPWRPLLTPPLSCINGILTCLLSSLPKPKWMSLFVLAHYN